MSSENNKNKVLPPEVTDAQMIMEVPKSGTDFAAELELVMADAPPEYLAVLAPTFKELLGLVQLATLGDAASVQELLEKPGSFLKNLCASDKGVLMGYLQARALHQVMTTESKKDPLDWAKLMADIEKNRNKDNERKDGRPGNAPDGAKEVKYELLHELEAEGKKVRKGENPRKDS